MAIQRASLNVFPTPELGRFVAARIATNRYGITTGVVRAALRLREDRPARWAAGTPHNPERT